jgi:hypothetical protein
MLKIRRCDDHRLHIFIFVELFVIARESDLATAWQLGDKRATIFATFRPNIRKRNELKIKLASQFHERRRETISKSIGKSDDADADAVIRARDSGVARCRRAQCRARYPGPGQFEKTAPGCTSSRHESLRR